nr:MAG TPA: hypothetical protein [Caudoviricetes sp.]
MHPKKDLILGKFWRFTRRIITRLVVGIYDMYKITLYGLCLSSRKCVIYLYIDRPLMD